MQQKMHSFRSARTSSMKHKTIPIFVPHMGCPNDCSFCNQKKITGQNTLVTKDDVKRQIEDALFTMPDDTDFVEIGFFGGSFTGIDKKAQNDFLEVAKSYKDKGLVQAIRLSTRPDYIDDEILTNLKSFGVTTIELGAQSMDDEVLLLNRRGHISEDTVRASRMIKDYGFGLGLQMMTGLFGDSDEKCMETLEKIISLHPDCVRIYPTLVLSGTHLGKFYETGKYKPQTLDEAVSLCADLKERLDNENIKIIRLGLMSSDNINPNADVLSGPYHPSFGELVQSEIYLRRILKEIDCNADILVNEKDISAFSGNKKKNIQKLEESGYNVKFIVDKTIERGHFKIIRKEQQ